MAILRLLLACVLSLAIPLEGVAAVAVADCGQLHRNPECQRATGMRFAVKITHASMADLAQDGPAKHHSGCHLYTFASCHSAAIANGSGPRIGCPCPIQCAPELPNAFFQSWAEPVPRKPPRV